MDSGPSLRGRLLALILLVSSPAFVLYLTTVARRGEPWTASIVPMLVAATIMLLLAGILARLVWTPMVARPIEALEHGAEALAKGDAAQVRGSRLPRELEGAAAAFDRMADAVQRTQLTLERQVADRTVELQDRNKQLIDATRYKTEFLANMSHEIRTPLNAVIGMSNVLSDMDLDEEASSAVETIRLSGHHLLTVISDILDISRIEAGRMDLEIAPLSTRDMIEEAVALVAPAARAKHLEMMIDIAPDVPEGLMGDAGRLRQILVNLTGNAAKFTDEGHIIVQARYEEGVLRLAVIDTGIGIPDGSVDQLFTAFHQLDATSHRRHGGTGLGLAISQRLSTLMGGTLSHTETPGGGATFTLLVPLEATSPPHRQPWQDSTRLQGKTALVVDDHAVNLRILRHQLEGWQMEVIAHQDVGNAAADLDVDVIVTDHQMPGMDGTEFIASLPEGHPPAIILTSGDSHVDDRSGIAAVLQKPTRAVELYGALLDALHEEGRPEGHAAFDHELASRRPLRILVVEDSAVNQRVATAMLSRFGYKADVAGGGREAIHLVVQHEYDIILMDVEMPDLNGREATRQILGSGKDVHIAAMTAHVSPEHRQACFDAGMHGYLAKPVSVEALRDELIAAWERRKSSNLAVPHT